MSDIRATIRMFMDSKAVTGAVDKGEQRYLKRYGAFSRTVARRQIKKRKKASEAGQGPSSHGAELLKRFLFYAFDPSTRSVVTGPAELSGPIRHLRIPRVLEEGGESPTSKGESAYVAPRPYMSVAKKAADAKIPEFLRDSVKG